MLFISCFYPSLKTVNPKNGHGNDVLLATQKNKDSLFCFGTSKESMSFWNAFPFPSSWKKKTFPNLLFQWKLAQLRSRSLLLGLEFVTLKTWEFSTRNSLNQHKNSSLSHSRSSWCVYALYQAECSCRSSFTSSVWCLYSWKQLGWHQQVHEHFQTLLLPGCPAILCAQLRRGGSAWLEGYDAAKPVRNCLLGQPVLPGEGTRPLQWGEHLQKHRETLHSKQSIWCMQLPTRSSGLWGYTRNYPVLILAKANTAWLGPSPAGSKAISTINQSCSMPCLATPLSLPHGGVLGVTGVGLVPTGGKSLCQGESPSLQLPASPVRLVSPKQQRGQGMSLNTSRRQLWPARHPWCWAARLEI